MGLFRKLLGPGPDAAGTPIPTVLPSGTPLFEVPDDLSKIMNRDLKAAGNPKKDSWGRTGTSTPCGTPSGP